MKKRVLALMIVLWMTVGMAGTGLSDVAMLDAKEVKAAGISDYSLTIDKENTTVDISQDLYGLFYEDINSSADGGMYPELIKNRSFENRYYEGGILKSNETTWKKGWVSNVSSNFRVLGNRLETPVNGALNSNNPRYAKLIGNQILTNYGFTEYFKQNTPSIPIIAGTKYNFYLFAKALSGYSGNISVRVVDNSGKALTTNQKLRINKNGNWNQLSTVLTGLTTSSSGKLQVQITGAKSTDVLYVDMISLMSRDTYGYGNKNYGHGAGLRKDLVQKLQDLNPKFIRFAGGCIVEGAYDWNNFFNWEDSIGAPEQRHVSNNMWGNDAAQKGTGYMMSYGVGFHEYLQLSEDLGGQALPIMNAGVLCQARSNEIPAADGVNRDVFVEYITHLIDYCWGDINSKNAVQKLWAKKRVDNGRSIPFNLNYIGIGNENWEQKYFDNFDYMKEKVLAYVEENYPGRTITIISSTGPLVDHGIMTSAWNWLNTSHVGTTLVDEHYYVGPEWNINNVDRYDYYTRQEDGGSDVFLGEYAVHGGAQANNTLWPALEEAAYMTGIERNSDVVKMIAYAPLFAKEGNVDWDPDMIRFDNMRSYGTPSYYVQKMFSNNYGTKLVNTTLKKKDDSFFSKNYGSIFLGSYGTKVEYDDIKIYNEKEELIFEDSFDNNDAGWTQMTGSSEFISAGFSIANGKLTINSGRNGVNAVWLPAFAKDGDWSEYRVEVNGKKLNGTEGFVIGAGVKGSDEYYQYNLGGWSNSNEVFQLKRPGKDLMIIGNDQISALTGFSGIKNEQDTNIQVTFGIDGKLKASHRSTGSNGDINLNLKPYQKELFQVVSADDDYIYVKLVNTEENAKTIDLNFENYLNLTNQVTIESLAGNSLADYNTLDHPENIVTKTKTDVMTDNVYTYTIPKYSCSIIKVKRDSAISDPVSDANLSKISIPDKAPISLSFPGESVFIKAFVTPSYAPDQNIIWSSSNPSVAKVDGVGRVTAVGNGTAVITASSKVDSQVFATKTVNVAIDNKVVVLSLNQTLIKLHAKRASQKFATVIPIVKTAASDLSVTWTSSNTRVATVDQKGRITAVAAGTAVITAKSKANPLVSAQCKVVVSQDMGVTQMQAPDTVKITKTGVSYRPKVQLLTNSLADKGLTWTSDNGKIVKAASNGSLVGVKSGSTYVTVRSKDNPSVYKRILVTVRFQAKKVTLNKKKVTLGVKEKVKLKAVKSPKSAVNKLSWSTSKKSVATVSKGVVTGRKPGKATISVKTSNGKIAKCKVTVKKAPKSIKTTVSKKTMKKGKTYQIKHKLTKKSASYKISYKSSSTKKATVSSTGLVKAKKRGTVTITLKTFNKKTATIKIKIK